MSERLDYRPARHLRLRTVRPKFVSGDNKALAPVVAPVGLQLAEKLQATPAMIAHIIVSKYADHQPLYRQAAILQDRHGLYTTRQTLSDWVMLAARWMRLVYEEVRSKSSLLPSYFPPPSGRGIRPGRRNAEPLSQARPTAWIMS